MIRDLVTLALSEGKTALRRNITAIVLVIVAGLLGLVGVGFLVLALYQWLGIHLSPLASSLVMAAGMFVVAVILYAVSTVIRARQRRQNAEIARALTAVPLAGAALSAVGAGRKMRLAAVLATTIGGIIIGRRLKR